MAEKNVKTLYVVEMRYHITLEAYSEPDAIRSAQYSSVEWYASGSNDITHLSQRVIRKIERLVPEPEPAIVEPPVFAQSAVDMVNEPIERAMAASVEVPKDDIPF